MKEYTSEDVRKRLENVIYHGDRKLKDLQTATGISHGSAYEICYYNRNAGIVTLKKICKFYGVSADWILFGEGEKYVKHD